MKQKITIVLAVVLVALIVWQVFFVRGDDFEIPNSSDTQIEEIVLDSEGQIVENMNTTETDIRDFSETIKANGKI